MTWTNEEREEARREYDRIGIAPGTFLPAPAKEFGDATEYLVFLRGILAGSGVAGFIAALGKRGS
jgi:hypothetical protein